MLHTLKNASRNGAFFLLLAVGTTSARADDCLDGTWAGTIGEIPVTLEFDTSESSAHYHGRYHYRDNLEDLYLQQDEQSARWREYDVKGQQTGALELACEDGKKLTGVWRTVAGDKSQALSAAPASGDPEKRIRNLTLQFSAPMAIGANRYRKVIAPGIKDFYTVTLQGDSAGIQALNRKLREIAVSDLSSIVDCASWGVMRNGTGQAWEESFMTSVSLWNADIVVLQRSFDGFCGGAHGASSLIEEVYSTRTGEREDVGSWLLPGEWPIGHYGEPEKGSLPALVWKSYQDDPGECIDRVSFERLWPTTKGLIFQSVADTYSERVCGTEVLVAWKSLVPFLSPLGKQRMNGLQGHK